MIAKKKKVWYSAKSETEANRPRRHTTALIIGVLDYFNDTSPTYFIPGDLNTITLEGYLVRDEVPEILQNAQLAYIKKEDSAVFSHRSTSEPNLSDVVTDSSFGSTDGSHQSNGFPRACSLDSHLDEPAHENTEEKTHRR